MVISDNVNLNSAIEHITNQFSLSVLLNVQTPGISIFEWGIFSFSVAIIIIIIII